ncbi:MAG TPA: GNAT family N-acetyltransferase [Candidatus Dormibacteraeota bacterium]|nr:GNAT family N-acetyltransferase [Candidatus Dormibacteraeota bacterium]
MTAAAPDLDVRPVRSADRERVEEIAPSAPFDDWVGDPSAPFEVGEVDGIVVAIHRLRPVAAGVLVQEGLAVAPGADEVGAAMVRHALDQARGLGFTEVRAGVTDEEPARLYEREGFRLIARCRTHLGPRMEGVDLPRMGSGADAPGLAGLLRDEGPWLSGYGGLTAGDDGLRDVDQPLIQRLAEEGRVRVGPGGRAFCLLEAGDDRLTASFLIGEGAALTELLQGLQFEADGMDVDGARLLAPDVPAAAELLDSVGYRVDDALPAQLAYGRRL